MSKSLGVSFKLSFHPAKRRGLNMETGDFILGTLDFMQQVLTKAVDGLTHEELAWRPEAEANPIGFVLWHQLRAEDGLIQGMIQKKPQVWVSERWYQKLNLPEADSGGRYTAEQVTAFPVPELKDLLGYAEAVRARTAEYLKAMTPGKFDEIIQAGFLGEAAIGKVLALLLCEIAQQKGR